MKDYSDQNLEKFDLEDKPLILIFVEFLGGLALTVLLSVLIYVMLKA